ncbi:kinesin-like protein KIN-7K, chloroplastic isoform X2 [Impatiens glandulifera]|uniref:kinesin-like protein KIN-7K, chloroplastic isoform X2 n=1 Tax=Impatiens glandulifera TaxID=253017 RepID=UPI001FB12FC5|nr:kinesin-like protein KIN-7K, chloroplastic isoform X2 [Impatiens glandulifera]
MASRQGAKSKRWTSKTAMNSHSSSTTSSSKQNPEDGQSSPAVSSVRSKPQHFHSDGERSKENVTVTVRFRPLSPREIRLGEEVAWYADGERIVRNEHNPSVAYAYDRVFGPTTTTRQVYDVAAQSVVSGAMEGINGTIFAYGVTSSGKTHTMHGDQRSPGIIPLTVKDVFSIIQETPNREFLLHVSYLEIYNEVINDLLNPVGQNLRIREDAQGTFVEGVKDEIVLSPAHALSLIAAGEEHRHVGSTNFNLHSSRSHTIFTLTVESSPFGENCGGEAVSLSQLHLIDLAGSESSKAETIGVRRREGSYINKSLLTLGTVISKLTDGRASHVPYRDSKLTRLLQSSLSGHGRVSLICTVTPSSSSTEETHNTLKFAHRAKHIEVLAAQNKIIDEKSLIKKYQNEIRCLKEELEQLKRVVSVPQLHEAGEDDIELLKQKFEDGQVKMQSRLEEEEETKGALLTRIQRLTKLILVSTKDTQSPRLPHRAGPRRRHSFGEEELAYLPHRRRDLILEEENIDVYVSVDGNVETPDDTAKEDKRARKNGLLNWLKPRKRDSGVGTLASASDKSSGFKSVSTPSTPKAESVNLPSESCLSNSHLSESAAADPLEARPHSFDDTPATSLTSIDLLREQQKILSGEVSLHFSALKRLSLDVSSNPEKEYVHEEIRELNDTIKKKNDHIALLEKQIIDSMITYHDKVENVEASLTVADLMPQLNDMSFELEVKVADNRVIQDQLDEKIHECEEMQETVASLKEQLSDALELKNVSPLDISRRLYELKSMQGEICMDGKGSVVKDSTILLQAKTKEIEELKEKVAELTEEKEQLELRNQKLAEESSYAKGLASAAAVELKALSEEVAKLMTRNENLTAQFATTQKSSSPSQQQQQRKPISTPRNIRRIDNNNSHVKRKEPAVLPAEVKRELAMNRERELSYEAALAEKEQREGELHRKIEESKQKEANLENELANMWVLVAKLKKTHEAETDLTDPLELWN